MHFKKEGGPSAGSTFCANYYAWADGGPIADKWGYGVG